MNPSALFAAVLLFVLPLFFFFFFFLAERRKKKSCSEKKIILPPSPPGLPFVGNLLQLGSLPHRSLRDLAGKHGPVFLLHLGRVPTVVVSSPASAEEFLRTHDLVFANRPALKMIRVMTHNSTAEVAFTRYGERWRQMRRICASHLFSSKTVGSFSPLRREVLLLLLERIASSASKSTDGVVSMNEILNSFAVDMICRTTVGSSMGEERTKLVADLVRRNSAIFARVFVEDYFSGLWWLDLLLGSDWRLRRLTKEWDDLLEEVIEEHVGRQQGGGDQSKSSSTTHAFIDSLLELQREPSLEFELKTKDIKTLLLDMFSAGIDTTTVTLEWAMAELIRHPKVMKKLQREVREVGHGDVLISEEDSVKMRYLNAVIKEVFRLHPPAPLLLPRESSDDCRIRGYDIPKGTRIFINAWAFGRDPARWEAPDEFRPERFLDSSADYTGNDLHFIPFGAGRRICPGLHFAVVDVELAVANLVYRFDWELPSYLASEDFKMEEIAGLVVHREQKLELVPTPVY
ncbi:Cytochrome P450 71A1 [Apostasia shenzhenica]|uniref:Cytochrome P450 71A1 n=1 Tax=Apostasia shenzhenica TaxID=1088818 RepID=A0A2I0AQ59_9ASPA|nr:Cytochrome P450 71A1 [Apostasia shenzhenica]